MAGCDGRPSAVTSRDWQNLWALGSRSRAKMFATDCAYHCPPRAVAIPRVFSASAISSQCVCGADHGA